jgi:hypothetical protein
MSRDYSDSLHIKLVGGTPSIGWTRAKPTSDFVASATNVVPEIGRSAAIGGLAATNSKPASES